jgi:CheY-like chemotaxis protein
MPTLLCIDDDPKILELQKSILETKGHSVLLAQNGQTEITLASEHAVDLVVLDFKMPGMDAAQVADVLFKEQPDVPVLTNSLGPATRERAGLGALKHSICVWDYRRESPSVNFGVQLLIRAAVPNFPSGVSSTRSTVAR